MSEESEKQNGREVDLRQEIKNLREHIEQDIISATPEQRKVWLVLVRVLSILNSEYGTIMRIMNRQDAAMQERKLTHEKLFGKGPGDDNCMSAQVAQTYSALRSVRRVGMAVLVALAVMMATKWYENIKLNEIIAQQKISNQPKQP